MIYPVKRKYLTVIPILTGYEVDFVSSAQKIDNSTLENIGDSDILLKSIDYLKSCDI